MDCPLSTAELSPVAQAKFNFFWILLFQSNWKLPVFLSWHGRRRKLLAISFSLVDGSVLARMGKNECLFFLLFQSIGSSSGTADLPKEKENIEV